MRLSSESQTRLPPAEEPVPREVLMPRTATRSLATRGIAVLLCFLLSPLPALTAQQAPGSGQKAGEIGALRPDATRNDQVLKVKDELQWNDFLKTLQTGRLRAQLLDGSLLSMGSNSQMRVLQHDAASQQTELELSFGRLRNRVVKLTKPGAKYEVKTPHAVIGVIGTDFYIFVDELRTVVIVYTGKVRVKQRRKSDRDPGALLVVEPGRELGAGQMLEVRAPGTTPPPPLGQPESTPPGVQDDSIAQTAVEERGERPPWSPKKKILVLGGITAAILTPIIIVVTRDDQGCSLCSSGP